MVAACPIRLRCALTALFLISGLSITTAQTSVGVPSITITNGKTFLAGEISISGDISAIDTKAFTCTPAQLFKNGDKVAAQVSQDQAWSVDKRALRVGTNQLTYPIMAMVKSSDGFHRIFPALLKTKIDIKAGEPLRFDGYQIETKPVVKAGDTIPVLLIGDAMLSVEPAEGAKDKSDTKPWFAAYKDGTKLSDRPALVEVWRVENDNVGNSYIVGFR
jgi:hypothetical protein